MPSIYTKTGDNGTTGLPGGIRVTKNCVILMVLGELDELNTKIGEAVAHLFGDPPTNDLIHIQRDLFQAGAEMAALQTNVDNKQTNQITSVTVKKIEKNIDTLAADLPNLKNFILPGGNPGGAHLHGARALCRRVERALVTFGKEREIRPEIYQYFNRLSDYLFTAARWINWREGVEEIQIP